MVRGDVAELEREGGETRDERDTEMGPGRGAEMSEGVESDIGIETEEGAEEGTEGRAVGGGVVRVKRAGFGVDPPPLNNSWNQEALDALCAPPPSLPPRPTSLPTSLPPISRPSLPPLILSLSTLFLSFPPIP